MKRVLLFLLTLTAAGFAENLVLENLTTYPSKSGKMAIQWAQTAKEVADENNAVIYGLTLNSAAFQVLVQPGKVNVNIPKKAEYFRLLVWTKGDGSPICSPIGSMPFRTRCIR